MTARRHCSPLKLTLADAQELPPIGNARRSQGAGVTLKGKPPVARLPGLVAHRVNLGGHALRLKWV